MEKFNLQADYIMKYLRFEGYSMDTREFPKTFFSSTLKLTKKTNSTLNQDTKIEHEIRTIDIQI